MTSSLGARLLPRDPWLPSLGPLVASSFLRRWLPVGRQSGFGQAS